MQIHLTKDDEEWLQAQVAAGRFSSLDEALTLAEAIDGLRAGEEALSWAEPLVAEGLAELDPRRVSSRWRGVARRGKDFEPVGW